MSVFQELLDNKLIATRPPFIMDTEYEVIMGSTAYGVSTDMSDLDIYAMTVSPLKYILPEMYGGYIHGFSSNIPDFKVFQEHHIPLVSKTYGPTEVDLNIYNITHYFRLVMDGNPNMIDSLFVPDNMVIHASEIGKKLRDNRHLFLSKKIMYSYFGYAHKQLHKTTIKNPKTESKRRAIVDKFGYDTKSAYHVVRLALQCEYALLHNDMILNNNVDILTAVRSGQWAFEDLKDWFLKKEAEIKVIAEDSPVQYAPEQEQIANLLRECLEIKYPGYNLSK